LLKVQDELSKSFNAKKTSELILSLISSSETFKSSSESINVMSFKTEDNVTQSQRHQEVNFFAMIVKLQFQSKKFRISIAYFAYVISFVINFVINFIISFINLSRL